MSFALKTSILPTARFSAVANVSAILRDGVSQRSPATLAKADALARIRAQLASQRH